jgi:hypothetical protein
MATKMQRRFERAAVLDARRRAPPGPKTILFGDSDVEFWEPHLPEWALAVAGVCGATMSDIADFAPRCLEKLAPELVVLVGGRLSAEACECGRAVASGGAAATGAGFSPNDVVHGRVGVQGRTTWGAGRRPSRPSSTCESAACTFGARACQ